MKQDDTYQPANVDGSIVTSIMQAKETKRNAVITPKCLICFENYCSYEGGGLGNGMKGLHRVLMVDAL